MAKMFNSGIAMLYGALAQYGSTAFADTTARTGTWFAVTVIEDAVFAIITDATRTGTADLTGVTFSAGTTIYGSFTAITLTSGTIIAYNAD